MSTRTSRTKANDITDLMSAITELNGKVDAILQGKGRARPGADVCGPESMVRYLLEDVDLALEREMVAPCDCRVSCKEAFTDFLQRSARLVQEESVEERKIMEMRKELSSLRSNAPYKKCSQCFDEVSSMFDRHVRMVRSQNTYVSDMNLRELIRRMDEEKIVKDVVDPLSNPLRLEMMKLMLDGPQTYSDLSVRTGLKGGNLLFHLQKLVATGMISQNQGRGDYALTEKGAKVLRYLTLITLDLGSVKWA